MDNKENKKMHCKIETTDDIMKVLKIIGFVILGIAACFGFGLVVKLLWNWLMPQIFGLPLITYWQGIGLLILSCILLGRLGGGDSGSHKDKHHKHHKNSIKEKIKNEIRIEIEKDLKKRNPDYKENQDDSMSKFISSPCRRFIFTVSCILKCVNISKRIASIKKRLSLIQDNRTESNDAICLDKQR
jgi:hypothetical protein